MLLTGTIQEVDHGGYEDKVTELDFPNKSLLGNTSLKKCFLSGIVRMRGRRALPELKNTIYTFIFDGRKRCTSCPKEGEGGGGGGNLGNARKKTFFFKGVVP